MKIDDVVEEREHRTKWIRIKDDVLFKAATIYLISGDEPRPMKSELELWARESGILKRGVGC